MTWLSSFIIAFLSGCLGLFMAGAVSLLCVEWYRISSFEGKSGYFVVFTALLGGLAAFIIGLIAARFVAAGQAPGFLKGLLYACVAVLSIAIVALMLCRLLADLDPKFNGKPVELEIEVRCPKDFQIPEPDAYGATAEVYLPNGRRLPFDKLQVSKATLVDEQLVVPATVPLTTRVSGKFLQVRFSAEHSLLFHLPLASQPSERDLEWSRWIESGWDASKPQPAQDAKFHMRFRVKTVEPAPPPRSPAVVRAEEFAALKPDASLEELLPFLFEGPTPESTAVVTQAIMQRQQELASLIGSSNEETRAYALRAVTYALPPSPVLVEAVLSEGRAIAQSIRQFNALPANDPDYDKAPDVRSRFDEWKYAWWTVHQHLRIDGRPPVQEIYDLASVRSQGTTMREVQVNAKAMLDQLNSDALEK